MFFTFKLIRPELDNKKLSKLDPIDGVKKLKKEKFAFRILQDAKVHIENQTKAFMKEYRVVGCQSTQNEDVVHLAIIYKTSQNLTRIAFTEACRIVDG